MTVYKFCFHLVFDSEGISALFHQQLDHSSCSVPMTGVPHSDSHVCLNTISSQTAADVCSFGNGVNRRYGFTILTFGNSCLTSSPLTDG